MISAFRLLLAPLCAIVFAAAISGSAAAADVFTVRGVHVDKTAESATAARSAAQAEGQRLALTSMMKKLTLPDDWGSLPDVDDATAQNAVRGFQVASEKTSSTRYIADMIVSFQPEAVRRLLRGAGLPFAETQARPALLLPVLRRGGELVLWEESNPWRDAWASLRPADELAPLMLPIGEIMEMNSVPAETAISNTEEAKAALAGLAANYGTAEVVVAEATLSADGGSLEVKVTHHGSVPADPLSGSYQAEGRDATTLMKAAAADMMSSLAVQWKRQIIVRDGTLSTLTVQADFSTLSEWERIRKGLTSTPLVQNMEVAGIAAHGAEIRISHKGSTQMLALSLAQQNVELSDGTAQAADEAPAFQDDVAPMNAEPGIAPVRASPRWHLSVRQ
ncbi:DUF2066 domain-containing protein [Parvibaculum sp.]|uniref:DUF2066 domain-containing protein n=1 Tax=Parvibaculum sp. TaxID=2024848 RepID=UPI003BA8D2BD